MALDAFLILESLHCIKELDLLRGKGSEPYLWPVLIRIDDLTIQTEALVDVTAPVLGNSRVVIKNDMRQGQTADIPTSVGVLRFRLEDSLFDTRLILILALWDEDDAPEKSVHAGFQAFVGALGAALGDGLTLLAIKDAEDNNDEEAKAAIAKDIQEQVDKKVRAAIKDSLTGPQKVAIKTGFLSMDDVIGTAFKGFSNALPAKFSLTTGAGTPNEFQIQGRLDVREVVIDPCQSQVNAVRQAQTAVNDVNNQIKALQEELKKASPAEKPFLISEIKRVREEELPIVQDALGAALTRLSICRSRIGPLPTENQQIFAGESLS